MSSSVVRIKPLIIGVAGGTGSGKTTVVKNLVTMIGRDQVAELSHDDYYIDLGHMDPEDRKNVNYDHPDALETTLLIKHLKALKAGRAINRPVYSFIENTRLAEVEKVQPAPVIMVEGILLFESEELRSLFDLKIFVDTDADIRLARRIKRDMVQRLRSPEYIIDKYLAFSRPMHLKFVEPNKRYADLIIPEGGENTVALNVVRAHVREIMRDLKEIQSLSEKSRKKK